MDGEIPALDGFTLFEGSKGWQLSTRRKGDIGFSIHFISDARAGELLRQIAVILSVAQDGNVQHQINDTKRQRIRLNDEPNKRVRVRL